MAHPVIVIKQDGKKPLHVQIREMIEIGRECDGIIIADGQASRRHATLTPRRDSVVVEDVGSTNGTFFDGTRVTSPVVLQPGSVVRIGDTVLQLVSDGAAMPAGSAPSGARSTTVTGSDSFGAAVKAGSTGPSDIRETSMDAIAREVGAADVPVPEVQVQQGDQGTITIAFSDIESSTERATSMGDVAWMKVLGAHNAIIRRHVEQWQGRVVKNQGDGFMVTFGGARRALCAMVGVQQELASYAAENPDTGVRIRVGVHTGEVIAEDGDIFGKHVMLAARIGSQAVGGEILVSSIVHAIASAHGDLQFDEPRTATLKGIGGEHVMYPLLWEGFAPSS